MKLKKTIIWVLIWLSTEGCQQKRIEYTGIKFKIKLTGGVSNGDWIRFDDLIIRHSLPDSSKQENPREFQTTNVKMVDKAGKEFSMAPSKTIIPLGNSGEWKQFEIPRGMIISSWIDCLAINQQVSGKATYTLDMPNYYSYEGYLIIERIDGAPISLTVSKDLPVIVEVMK